MLASYFTRAGDEPESAGYAPLAQSLVEWFEKEHGSINCFDLVRFDQEHIAEVCPGIIAGAFDHCVELLRENGIDPCAIIASSNR